MQGQLVKDLTAHIMEVKPQSCRPRRTMNVCLAAACSRALSPSVIIVAMMLRTIIRGRFQLLDRLVPMNLGGDDHKDHTFLEIRASVALLSIATSWATSIFSTLAVPT